MPIPDPTESEQRPDHRPDGRRPHDDADRRRPTRRPGHVARSRTATGCFAVLPEPDEQRPDGAAAGTGRPRRPRVAISAPITPTVYPVRADPPPRAPRSARRGGPIQARTPRTTVAPGAPAQTSASRSMSLATIVATVTAAMCPVLPSATPVIQRVPCPRPRRVGGSAWRQRDRLCGASWARRYPRCLHGRPSRHRTRWPAASAPASAGDGQQSVDARPRRIARATSRR